MYCYVLLCVSSEPTYSTFLSVVLLVGCKEFIFMVQSYSLSSSKFLFFNIFLNQIII